MHRRPVGSGGFYGGMGYGNGTQQQHRRKDDRGVSVTYGRGDGSQHCSGIQSLLVKGDHLFTASRDSTVKRWWVQDGHQPKFETSFEGHSDWVNDLVMVGDLLATGSNDKTVKLWNPQSPGGSMCISQRAHSDYVSALASAPEEGLLASAGLRAEIFVWDLKQSPEMRERLKLFPNDENKDKGSIYALNMNEQGGLLAAGSTDAVIRIFDMKQGKKIMKLKGHTDNVRCVVLNAEGTRMLTGSSDHTVKLWDLGHQRCIQTLHCHTDSVWSLLVGESFNTVLSGGRDKSIYRTNLTYRTSELLFVEDKPIQKMASNANGSALWVATGSSSVNKWSVPAKLPTESTLWNAADGGRAVPGRPFLLHATSRRGSEVAKSLEPLQSTPVISIKGLPPIVHQVVLNNRWKVLAKDEEGVVTIWDITSGRVLEDLGKVDFKEAEIKCFEPVSHQRWFSCDNRLGMLTITLNYPQCHHVEVYANDFGIMATEDRRLVFGDCMLRGLFGKWAMQKSLENEINIPEETFEGVDVWGKEWVDGSGRIVPSFRFWEMKKPSIWVSSETLQGDPWCMRVDQVSGKLRDVDDLPEWVGDCVLRLRTPIFKESKGSFHLQSEDPEEVPELIQTRLNAPRILQVRKVASYLKQKLQELEPPFPANIPAIDWDACEEDQEASQEEMDKDLPELELVCQNMAIPFSMSIGAVHDFIGNKAHELSIVYRIKGSKPAPLPTITPRIT
ncbi:hypothetical protein BSKO_10533 [Bryopsis sp. KO-2023]|nr:hypothetical protein BSKO_10533 [Bryopsis sp. KO-2023]